MTDATFSTDFFGEFQIAPKKYGPQWFRQLGIYASTGFILVIANFPKFLSHLIDINVSNPTWNALLHVPVNLGQALLGVIIGDEPTEFFRRAMACNFFLLILFFLSVAGFSVRRRGVQMLLYAALASVAGYFVVHLLAWGALGIALLIQGVLYAAHWIRIGISFLFSLVFDNRWLVLVLAVAVGIYFLTWTRFGLMRWLWLRLLKYRTGIASSAIVCALAYFLVPALWNYVIAPVLRFLKMILQPIFSFLAFVFGWIFFILGVLFGIGLLVTILTLALATIGALYVSQLQAGWHAARSKRDMVIAGFAIGSAFAMIAVESFASPIVSSSLNQSLVDVLALFDLAGSTTTSTLVTDVFQYFLPPALEAFAHHHLINQLAPAFDSLVFLGVMIFACCSVLFRLFSTRPVEDAVVPITYVAYEFVKLTVGVFVLLVFYFLQVISGEASA